MALVLGASVATACENTPTVTAGGAAARSPVDPTAAAALPSHPPPAPTATPSPSPAVVVPSSPPPVAPSGVGDVDGLEPAFRDAVRRALDAAAAAGVHLHVTSGYRTPEHQQEIFDAGLAKYGTAEAARSWVLPPEESEHVQGRAVDVGPAEAASWLEIHGPAYGLCRRYDNEPWHFELLAANGRSDCPARQATAAG